MIIILDLFLRLRPERGIGDVVGEVRGELQVDKTGVHPEVEQFGVRNSRDKFRFVGEVEQENVHLLTARNLAGVEVVETQLTVEVTVGGESDGRDVRGEVVSHRVEVTESWHLWATNIVARYWRICPN